MRRRGRSKASLLCRRTARPGVAVIDWEFGAPLVFAIPLLDRFRGISVREGVLFEGPAGWAEFAPFRDYDDRSSVPWLQAAIESATKRWPAPNRRTVPVNATVPIVGPERAAEIVAASGCTTAKIKVADLHTTDPNATLDGDAARVAAVRSVLGPTGHIRVDANGAWTVAEAMAAIAVLDDAAGGLQYVEQPCRTLEELAALRRLVTPLIAADESIRHADDPMKVALAGAADIAVIKVAPLGGVRRALAIAAAAGLPVVVSSAVDTAVGLSAGLALAGALPELPYACGLGTGGLLVGDVSSAAAPATSGRLAVPDRAPEPDRFAEFRADPETERFWLDRLDRVRALLPLG